MGPKSHMKARIPQSHNLLNHSFVWGFSNIAGSLCSCGLVGFRVKVLNFQGIQGLIWRRTEKP